MKFTYLGKAYDLFEDNIIDKENFLASEDNDTGQNIILKHGIRQICDFFGFKDYDLKILLAQDTNTWGTTFVLEQRMIRRAEKENEPIEDRMFTGDGEINEKNCSFPYPIAVGRKRARSRAVLWELGLEAYGEEEAEDFAKEVRKQREKKPTFTKSKTAVQVPSDKKDEKKPASKNGDVSKDNDADEAQQRKEAQQRLQKLKETAQKLGLNNQDAINVLKSDSCLNIGGMPRLDQLIDNPEVFATAEKLLKELAANEGSQY